MVDFCRRAVVPAEALNQRFLLTSLTGFVSVTPPSLWFSSLASAAKCTRFCLMKFPAFRHPRIRECRKRNRLLRVEQLEGRQVLASSVSGAVFSDLNSDGVFQPAAGETAIASRRVYIDANANGRFDSATEASALTAADGTYSLGNLAAANYRLVLEGSEDWE